MTKIAKEEKFQGRVDTVLERTSSGIDDTNRGGGGYKLLDGMRAPQGMKKIQKSLDGYLTCSTSSSTGHW